MSNYNGWFVSPEATYGMRLPLASFAPVPEFARNAAVVPSAKVRYLAAWYERYTETGSTANLTGNERSLQTFEGRLLLALTNALVDHYGTRRHQGGVLTVPAARQSIDCSFTR